MVLGDVGERVALLHRVEDRGRLRLRPVVHARHADDVADGEDELFPGFGIGRCALKHHRVALDPDLRSVEGDAELVDLLLEHVGGGGRRRRGGLLGVGLGCGGAEAEALADPLDERKQTHAMALLAGFSGAAMPGQGEGFTVRGMMG